MNAQRLLPALLLTLSPLAAAQAPTGPPASSQDNFVYHTDQGLIVGADASGTYVWATFSEYVRSNFFFRHRKHCGAPARAMSAVVLESQINCSSVNTTVAQQYDPGPGATHIIEVWVHVLTTNNGQGSLSQARIDSQIQVLNDDFAAAPGSKIQFVLAGTTTTANRRWFNDQGNYWNTLARDTTRYLNIYTNTAGGNLGYAYVPSGGGVVGNAWDGVRIHYEAFGVNPANAPYGQGQTATHEVGHYLGLYHTFDGGCHGGDCNQQGDLICDTAPEASPNYSACGFGSRDTCSGGGADPIENFMDYSYDACMNHFSAEQANRMRCTIEEFRPGLLSAPPPPPPPTPPGAATSPSPSNGATGVSTSPLLTWTTGSGGTSDDIYFGTTNPLVSGDFQGNALDELFDPGTLANDATYYWRIDSRNSAGATAGATWSFTTEAGGSTGGDLFYDGFESGGFGLWSSTSSNASVSGGAASVGAFGAQLRRNAHMEFMVDTTGITNPRLSFDVRTLKFDAGETLTVSVNGGAPIYSERPTGWVSVPPIALGSGLLTVRFESTADRNNERAFVDEVRVTQ